MTLQGAFEAHITVSIHSDDTATEARFRQFCSERGVKAVWIQLARGHSVHQPMTSSYHQGTYTEVKRDILHLAEEIRLAGFVVDRVKIESRWDCAGIPQTDEEARQTPQRYFECHYKLRLHDEVPADLLSLCNMYGAHISKNNYRAIDAHFFDRFVTLRCYDVGQKHASDFFQDLQQQLSLSASTYAYELVSMSPEYTVYDSNVNLDDGWLSV